MGKSIIDGPAGTSRLLVGNEAIARGALEAGVSVASSYPGTPSTEILEALSEIGEKYGIYVEWSTNEKVALEIAIGASMCNVRSIVCMKHVGVNVASDPLMSLGYSGVEGGLVIVTADDPNAHSSQNEQDNRYYGLHSYIPVFEPSNPQEAKDLTQFLFDFSEKYKTAVFLRSTTRLSHTRSKVVFGDIRPVKTKGIFCRNYKKWVLLPVNSRKLHQEAIKRIEKISLTADTIPFNIFIEGDSDVGIIASGVAYEYLREALSLLKISSKPNILKSALSYPLPLNLVEKLFENSPQKIIVIEELEPIIEFQLRTLADQLGYQGEILGKSIIPRTLELNTYKVMKGLAEVFNIPFKDTIQYYPKINLPLRPPTMCPGCGHRSTYYAVKMAVKRSRVKAVYPNDIGCYTLGYFPPLNMADLSFSMGSSIGIGLGIAKVSDEVVISFIGDSTFFHAGIPAIIDSVYNRTPVIIVVMDNFITAMTGHQPHPGSGVNIRREKTNLIRIEDIVRAVGVKFVEVVDAYDVKKIIDVVSNAIRYVKENNEPAVIISRRPCALLDVRRKRREGEKIVP
ncbi:MAG: indolepyruvate ferredoxin oxidoreductase subunit alpha, partial [Thermofilum sp. ex4484_79]